MQNGDMGERAQRKLERLVARSLAGVTPRICRALGILELEKKFRQESGSGEKNVSGEQQPGEQKHSSECSLQETSTRVPAELSS